MKNSTFWVKFLCLIIIFLGVSFVVHAASFADVSSVHTNYDAIEYVKENGIVKGYDDGGYKPDALINRAEFTKIIIEAVFPGQAVGSNCFSDVGTEWFAKYICTAQANNIINGYPDGTFKPSQNIAFVEAAKIIVKAFGYAVANDEIWYKPFVIGLGTRNAIPTSIDEFGSNITRAEMAEIIYRLHAQVATKPSKSYEMLESLNVQGTDKSVESDEGGEAGSAESAVTEWQTYENANVGIRFQYPKNWYIHDDGESLAIQNVPNKFDMSNAPQGFQLFWIVYEMSSEDINTISQTAQDLQNGSPQYSQIEEEIITKGDMSIRIYTFFDNDCGKSVKAFLEYKDRGIYAFHGRFCGQQITDDELSTFNTIMKSFEFLESTSSGDPVVAPPVTPPDAAGAKTYKAIISTTDELNDSKNMLGVLNGEIEIIVQPDGAASCNWNASGSMEVTGIFDGKDVYVIGPVNANTVNCYGTLEGNLLNLYGHIAGGEPYVNGMSKSEYEASTKNNPMQFPKYFGDFSNLRFRIQTTIQDSSIKGVLHVERLSFQSEIQTLWNLNGGTMKEITDSTTMVSMDELFEMAKPESLVLASEDKIISFEGEEVE